MSQEERRIDWTVRVQLRTDSHGLTVIVPAFGTEAEAVRTAVYEAIYKTDDEPVREMKIEAEVR
jgi:hypothetical protein